VAIVVSEQTGKIATFKQGKIQTNVKPEDLKSMLIKEFWEKE
jgi:DNA integrity scanning protein DisA with diadenylate cyclase activity